MRATTLTRQIIATCLLLFTLGGRAQVQLLNITSQTAPGLSSTCLAVLNQQVACNTTLAVLGRSGSLRIYSDQFLVGLCTSSCSSSLTTWLRRVSGACGAASYMPLDASSQTQVIPAYFAEKYLEYYQQTCLPGAGGSFCNAVIGTAAGINPDNQAITQTPNPTMLCNSCYLSLISTQLQQPLASNAAIASMYIALTSSCHVTSMPTTPLTTTTSCASTTATSTATATGCAGTTYTVQAGDTCQSLSYSQNIGTISLLMANNLQAYCNAFPTSGTLCIPSSLTCTPYTVQLNDTCASIALAQTGAQVSYAQILSWNPSLGGACGLIGQYVGYTICISSPGGYSGPTAGPVPTTVTSTAPTDTVKWTPFSMLTMTSNGSAPAQPSAIAPFANGTRDDCGQYVTAPVLVNATANLTSNDCAAVASAVGVALSDFAAWNSLSLAPSCTLTSGLRYCSAPFVTQSNATAACVQFELPDPGYDCVQFVRQYGVDITEFVAWNPDVGSSCDEFSQSLEYCIAVLGYRQPGIISTCNKFVMPNDTNWIDEPCTLMETAYGLSHPRFVAWNPAVQQNCSGLSPGYEYCVSIPNYKPTYTTPSPATYTEPAASYLTASSSS
ncbi:hypothetical protein C8A05DRAFT_18986 [Staphylotrichum tortipilum]|uniref:LysM domain-containing protein n=1 Tax=Staphylotrichum tortipilum TaxID=2831512 RepID=A0AAN6MCV5_9PEZI|nr:hypothetical protein C8A05DRAFT_18986 [Staphylotrichum longicolle]